MNILLSLLLFATPPAAAPVPPSDQGPAHGAVLVLENEQTLLGDIERAGDLYRVRRLLGETTIPAGHVLRLCADMKEAYTFVRGRCNLTDPDERLRVAEWCRLNGLHDEAAAEVKAAVDLRPDDPASRRLLAYLQTGGPAKPAPVKPSGDADPANPRPAVDLTEEAMGQFATKVQPILMNACANCHATGHGGGFRLTRSYDAAVLNRKTLQQNLAAVLAEVNPDQPRSSPFLSKAVSVHGAMEQAPIKNRQAVAYRTLEDWVRATLADNPQLHEHAPAPPTVPVPFAEVRPVPFTGPAEQPAKAPDAPRAAPATPTPPAAPGPPEPADPYSPDAFNKQFHAGAPAGKPKP